MGNILRFIQHRPPVPIPESIIPPDTIKDKVDINYHNIRIYKSVYHLFKFENELSSDPFREVFVASH